MLCDACGSCSNAGAAARLVLQVLDAVMAHAARQPEGAAARGSPGPLLSWPHCMEDSATEAERAADALARVIETWPGRRPQLSRAKLMPYMDAET